jgi:hypothetical protein
MLGTPVFGEFLPFFSADPLKLCEVGWGASLHSYFRSLQRYLIRYLIRFKSGLLVGQSRTLRPVPKPLQCFGSVLRVVVLLESEPSLWIWSRFSSRISVHLSLDPD